VRMQARGRRKENHGRERGELRETAAAHGAGERGGRRPDLRRRRKRSAPRSRSETPAGSPAASALHSVPVFPGENTDVVTRICFLAKIQQHMQNAEMGQNFSSKYS
jgi:hypothetical protein